MAFKKGSIMKEINNFEEYLKYELNYSDYTIKEYILHVKDFLKYLENNKINYLNITKEGIVLYSNIRINNNSIFIFQFIFYIFTFFI